MSFLPQDYQLPTASNGYMKLEKGTNKFRVLSNSIVGYETWIEDNEGKRKPRRFRKNENIPVGELGEDGLKHFWAFVVWNYDSNSIQILEITQRSIMDSMLAFYKDEDYGDPKGYDIVIERTGEGLDTRYQVTPKPPKALENSIKKTYEATNVNLEALYDGADPFASYLDNSDVVEDALKAGI